MPFEIHYGAWIQESDQGFTVLAAASEEQLSKTLKKSLDSDAVDAALLSLKEEIVERLRRG